MNILRATNHSLEPEACGVQDKSSIIPAITQVGRAPQRDNTLLRHFCECSNVATIKRGNAKICQRCADIDSKVQPQTAGKSRFWGAPSQREYTVTLGGWK
jgi:hypothetical protein